MTISGYVIEIDADVDGEEFSGKVVISVTLTTATRDDPVKFYVEDLDVNSVVYTIFQGSNVHEADFNVDDGILEIEPGIAASSYTFTIEYSGSLAVAGKGMYVGHYGDKQNVRPGQQVRSYALEISVNGDSFEGRAVLDVVLTTETRDDDIVLHVDGLDVGSVQTGVFSIANAVDADFNVDGNQLMIAPRNRGQSYFVIIEYSGSLADNGRGLYLGHYDDNSYVAMNLHPTYARRVFPCMDEPTELSIMSFTFNDLDYTHLISNSQLEENSQNQFRPLTQSPHLWGMIAHNFVNINIPIANVLLYGRPGVTNQDAIASLAINSFYANLNEWTNKVYTEIILHQDGRMNIMALPDVSTDWHSLSMVGIWEPYIFMETTNSVKQRSIALPKIAEAMAKQWFGYVVFPQNWRYEWVVSGLASYAGWQMVKMFQGDGFGTDTTMLDVHTLFVTEVIHESLLRDSYQTSKVLEPEDDLFDEEAIRDHIGPNGILKYKAPAIMNMIRVVLGGEDTDYVQLAARALVNRQALEWVNTLTFIDAVNSEWIGSDNNDMVGDFGEYLEPWISHNGYPLIRVSRVRGSGVLLSQERFGFSNRPFQPTRVPITYTTSIDPNFDIDNIYPFDMFDQSHNLVFALGDDDWVLFNIQGQGYYRVNYDNDLWELIIGALEDPEAREEIHPLNRATLIDDALNIARAGRLDYDIAFRVVLSMEHETEYAPWKAFVRNMEFLRKRLVAYVDGDDELDQDIYLRMVRRTIHAFENEIGFYPDMATTEPTMQTLTRGLVMEHACKANYAPCIAAAVDWFYERNNVGVVNPNIPHEIRPAVYCTMVREGDEEVIEALEERLDLEPTHYERLVILESFACSQDEDFINELLDQTIAEDSPYLVEERLRIFAAVAESSVANANLARNFMRIRTGDIRNMYGGPEKLEEAFFILAENMVDPGLAEQFEIWAGGQNNQLDDSQGAADRALQQIQENLIWDDRSKEEVYEWIDENHAPTLMLSAMALSVNVFEVDYEFDNEELYICPWIIALSYIVIIEYTGYLTNTGLGLHLGRYDQDSYVAMNLNPTYARRVFPCMDEPTETAVISIKFNNLDYTHLVSNSLLEANSENQFRVMILPPHLLGMIAHNFININIPINNVRLFGRSGTSNQDFQASVAINFFYANLNEWTRKPYTEIVNNQHDMNIIALPDVSIDWNALSIVGIWEPYVFMETTHSVKQRSLALPKIAEAMAKQWFGFKIFPQNWRYEWVVSGLASYAGWEVMKKFFDFGFESDLDVNTLFTTEVIQESLLRDSYSGSGLLEPYQDLFDENEIRDHIGVNGVQKYKAPALMRMMRNLLGAGNVDYIQRAASMLLSRMSIDAVDSLSFVDAVNMAWFETGNALNVVPDFLEPWMNEKGYPLLEVMQINNNLVLIYQEVFGFNNENLNFGRFIVPITYTTSRELDFSEQKLQPTGLSDGLQLLPTRLGDNDWVLFNIQGQGYYRVNYDLNMWEKLIKALNAPLTRNQIHPLNRATLVDDALNVARAGKLKYEVALRVVLTMEHETEYAPWKAFVRNMDFLRKRLMAYVNDAEDLDQDIYLRIIKKTIRAFEENIGFYPDVHTFEPAMQSLTRGLVMDHACRANYQPCIDAAKNWFYNPNNDAEVNPNIPRDIRPAVYCTMVREGDGKVVEALEARLNIEPTLYEKVVILESFACSKDKSFIEELLERTIAANSPYGVEERLKIFAAVAGSSFANADLALSFMRMRTNEIKRMYGSLEKFEEAIFILADNMVDEDLSEDFGIWVYSQNNMIEESQRAAERALGQVQENLHWNRIIKEDLYKLIAEYTS
ncbi:hypothetical protein PYW07_001859 [Mythimna separata]|uniref:Aminopeptidase N n=1 Tax=Mythimna separata TaxID=271217 RepID=A0AAD7YW19_MYTSE|nr:hypothetical protein PYW07_001859 [Mythimna separata]